MNLAPLKHQTVIIIDMTIRYGFVLWNCMALAFYYYLLCSGICLSNLYQTMVTLWNQGIDQTPRSMKQSVVLTSV
jgi:hypothetical protein